MVDTKLSKKEGDNLATYLEAWVSSSKKERAALREKIVHSILKERGHDADNPYAMEFVKTVRWTDPTMLVPVALTSCQRVNQWFSNHVPTAEPRLPKEVKTAWTAREVFHELEAETLEAEINALIEKGTPNLAAHNTVRSAAWKKLKKDRPQRILEFERKAVEWTEGGPPLEVQAE